MVLWVLGWGAQGKIGCDLPGGEPAWSLLGLETLTLGVNMCMIPSTAPRSRSPRTKKQTSTT